jgi:sugar lactone lactonase YvrE
LDGLYGSIIGNSWNISQQIFMKHKIKIVKQQILILLTAVALLFAWQAEAQTYDTNNDVVQTFAGSGFSGYLDGQGTQTMFNGPTAIAADSSSNLFVFDYYNSRIRKITPDGAVSTFVGGGTSGLPGYGTNVTLGSAESMTIDHSNTLYLVNYPSGTSMVRVGSDGYASTVPLSGLVGGQARDGICVDSGNNVYIADNNGNKIFRYRTNGVLEVFAGSGNSGSADGNGIFTSFASPSALAADTADNIYVWDSGNNLIRRINQNRDVVTIAGHQGNSSSDGIGTNASFYGASSICADGFGNIYLASFSVTGGSSIRKITAATNVTTLAESFTQHGYTNGAGNLARFDNGGEGICVSQGTIFVADFSNERTRQITFNPQPQIVSGANLSIGTFAGLTITGVVGRTYQIQTSPDLNSWSTRATILLNSSPYIWIDQNPVNGNKFYRALLLP